jgi:polyhydroxyalkanoate synthesis regulator phasin
MVMENIAKQIIDFQKSTFDNSFDAVVMLQDQAERMTKTVVDQATWLPDEGKKAMDEWVQMVKKGRDDLKELVDQNFDKMADFFEDPATIFTQPKVKETKPAKAAK